MGCFGFLKRRRSPKIHPYMDEEEIKDIPPQVPFGKKYFRLGLDPPPRGWKALFTFPHWKRDRKGVCWIRDNGPIYPCPPPPPPTPPPARARPLLRPLPALPPPATSRSSTK
ncbi:hypothetical protein KP79_PYT11274 [Mizuhopecten yessoensis]|uniref:Uncharacterized protein n=1 Tax=Mizuhopecten yessoensis TaxID=6573 RepID=A0A210Q945_MIZYE|nr:hypothetical protein KP79_PYT11274 [Mizuhopecten yessoensis]